MKITLTELDEKTLTAKDRERLMFVFKQIIYAVVVAKLESAGIGHKAGFEDACNIYSPKPIQILGEYITEPNTTQLN
jgi:hypothetical protein